MAVFSILPEILATLWGTVRFYQVHVPAALLYRGWLSQSVVVYAFNLPYWVPHRKRPRNVSRVLLLFLPIK